MEGGQFSTGVDRRRGRGGRPTRRRTFTDRLTPEATAWSPKTGKRQGASRGWWGDLVTCCCRIDLVAEPSDTKSSGFEPESSAQRNPSLLFPTTSLRTSDGALLTCWPTSNKTKLEGRIPNTDAEAGRAPREGVRPVPQWQGMQSSENPEGRAQRNPSLLLPYFCLASR
jgi:hypothetical protein